MSFGSRFAWILVLLLLQGVAQAEETVFTSPKQQATLLELYTSEGCSSCPPADRWLSKLLEHENLWQQLVPVAFHVDYWNYLGWEDRFSKPAYSQRQRNLARLGNVRSVYTPGLVRAGKEWRRWFFSKHLGDLQGEEVGELRVAVASSAEGENHGLTIRASFDSRQQVSGPLELNVALLGFDMQTRVRAGENEGKILRHDFVVLQHARQTSDGSGNPVWEFSLPKSPQAPAATGIAAWVSQAGSLTPIQATGGLLP